MAGNIKGITIEFRGDTTKLDKALRQINTETRNLDKELKQVDKALKFNPTSVELWRQKQQLLTQKIAETKEKLTLLKNEQARMDAAGVDKSSEEYRKLQREIIETESKVKTFEGQLRKVGQVNLRAASEQFKVMGDKLTSAGQAMRGISTAAAAVAASIGAITVKSGKWADDINTMSKVYGIGTRELQKYSAAAQLVDVDVETIAKSHTKLEKSMYSAQNGSKSAVEAFDKLGVSVTDANGNLRDGDAVWNDAIKALGKMENETERDAVAMQLMGKSAQELNPLIEDGGKTYKRLAKTLKKYDLDFIDQETLEAANEFNDELDTIKAIGLVTIQKLGTQLAGYLAPAMSKVVGWIGKIAQWLSNLSPRTQAIIAGIAAAVAVIAPLLIGMGKISFAISSIMSLMSVLGPAIGGIVAAMGPVVVAIAAVVAAGVLLYKNWDEIKAKAIELWNKLKEVFANIKTTIITIWNNIKTSVTNTVNSIKTTIITVWNNIKASVVSIITSIKTTILSVWNAIKSAITTVVTAIKNTVNNVWTSIKNTAASIWTAIKTVISSKVTAIKNAVNFSGLVDKVKKSVSGVKDALSAPFSKAKDLVSSAVKKLKNMFPIKMGKIFSGVKLPHFKISGGKIPWGIGGKGVKPTVSIQWYKQGGIMTRPTVFGGGEAGDEAILPLDPFWRKMDELIAAQQGGGITVNVYGTPNMSVDDLAEAVEQRLVMLQKRREMAYGGI